LPIATAHHDDDCLASARFAGVAVSRLNASYRRDPWFPAPFLFVTALVFGCLAASPSAAQTRPDSIPAARNAAVVDSEIVDPADIAPPVSREFRGVWVVSVGNMDWPSRPGLPVAQQKSELVTILDRAAALNLNAVVLQVRPSADALYASKKEPWSAFLTGQMGRAPVPFYDPLEFAVQEAHARGLELHAWVNPYRAHYPDDTSRIVPSHIARRRPDLVVRYGPYLWLDPGSSEVRAYTVGVVRDIVRRYDIDGLHIDDYFYPYRERSRRRDIPFPDNRTWRAYRARGGTLSRDDWRRRNVDLLVEELHAVVKQEKPWVKFGISPFGIWRPGSPASVRGLDAYTEIYADSRKWLQRGWLDYFTPQLYWRSSAPQQSYAELLHWWTEQNAFGRHLWVGNYTSRVMSLGANWPASEVLEQIRLTRADSGATGNLHFSMEALLRNRDSLNDRLVAGPYAAPALVPASPWLKESAPSAPRATANVDTLSGRTTVTIAPVGKTPVRLWVVRSRFGATWTTSVVPGTVREHSFAASDASARPDVVVVTAIGRTGLESPETRLQPSH
jgi:uncharacterized lipoprotein YddW (UPF0748 family)